MSATLQIGLGGNVSISEQAKETANKLNIGIQETENTASHEAYITAFPQYFMLQQDKIALNLLDDYLPVGVRAAWEELLALLERRNRKLVKVEKGSVLFQLYCPTQTALDDLEEVIDSIHFNTAVINFYKVLGAIYLSITNPKNTMGTYSPLTRAQECSACKCVVDQIS